MTDAPKVDDLCSDLLTSMNRERMWAADVTRGEPGSVVRSKVAGSKCSIHHHECGVTVVGDRHVASWVCAVGSPE